MVTKGWEGVCGENDVTKHRDSQRMSQTSREIQNTPEEAHSSLPHLVRNNNKSLSFSCLKAVSSMMGRPKIR